MSWRGWDKSPSLFLFLDCRVRRSGWVLKANYKIEEKNGMITSIDGHSQDEAKGLYWMYKINGEMAPKGAAETTVKKGDKIEFYQEVYK